MATFSLDFIYWMQETGNVVTETFFRFVSLFGEKYFLLSLLAAIYWAINKRLGEFLAVTLGLSLTLAHVFKGFTAVERPFEAVDGIENRALGTAEGSAFPSAHVQGAASVFTAVAAWVRRRAAFLLAAVLMLGMMLSRLYLGVSGAVDVVTGGVFGIVVLVVHGRLYRSMGDDALALRRYYSMLAFIFLLGLFIFEEHAFYRAFGLFVGILVAVSQERTQLGFTTDVPWRVKLMRVFVGLLLIFSLLFLLRFLFGLLGAAEGSWLENMLDFIRYLMVAYFGFFLYPGLFTIFENRREQ